MSFIGSDLVIHLDDSLKLLSLSLQTAIVLHGLPGSHESDMLNHTVSGTDENPSLLGCCHGCIHWSHVHLTHVGHVDSSHVRGRHADRSQLLLSQ